METTQTVGWTVSSARPAVSGGHTSRFAGVLVGTREWAEAWCRRETNAAAELRGRFSVEATRFGLTGVVSGADLEAAHARGRVLAVQGL